MKTEEHRHRGRSEQTTGSIVVYAGKSASRLQEHRHRHRCQNCGRQFMPAAQVAHKQRYCSHRCQMVVHRMRKLFPLSAALTAARGDALSGPCLTPAAIRAIATLLALRPLDVDPAKAIKAPKRIATKPAPPTTQITTRASRTELFPWPRNNAQGHPVGVDFRPPSTKFAEVKKLLLSYGFKVNGLDFEDLYMIIVETIVRRNRMRCAFDPDKSGFAHYVHILARNVCINLSIAQKRVPELTETGELGELLDEGIDDPADRLDLFESLTTEQRAAAAQIRRSA